MKKENKNFLSKSGPDIWLILIVLFFYLPIIYVVIFSFNSTKSLNHFTGFSLMWYDKMFNDRKMLEPIYYTVLVAVIATIVATIIGTITSIGLSKQKKIVRDLVLQVNDLPVMNPDIVTAIGLMLFFISLNIETSIFTLLIAHITFCIPFVVLSIMPKLRTLDDNVAEAALDLGATPFQALTRVIIPQIKPAILSGALIAFSMSFDDFVISFFTTGTGVSNISIYVYSMSKRINPTINALSSLIVAVVTTVLIIANVIPFIKSKRPQTQVVKKKSKYSFVPYLAGALALVIFLVSFGTRTTGEFDPIAEFGSNTLNIFNYGEYVGENVIAEFEDMYNVKVNYDTFSSNEEMYTKLMSGASYDVIIPSDYMVQKLIKDGLLQPLDKEILTNLTDLYPDALKYMEFDPEMIYAVPYLWGTVGIIYDETLVDPEDVETLGWDVFLLEKYRGMVYFYDSERDAFMVALKALGYSMNTKNEAELLEAYNWLIEMDNAVDPAYVTDEIIDGIINGEKALGYVYSGDATYMIYENENLRFYEPHQGTNVWMDCMIIPKNAKSPELANFFINYMLSYDVAYANSEYIGYTSPNEEVLTALSSEDGEYYGIDAYVPRVGFEDDETFINDDTIRKIISEYWVKIKIN